MLLRIGSKNIIIDECLLNNDQCLFLFLSFIFCFETTIINVYDSRSRGVWGGIAPWEAGRFCILKDWIRAYFEAKFTKTPWIITFLLKRRVFYRQHRQTGGWIGHPPGQILEGIYPPIPRDLRLYVAVYYFS